jgi:hypothetical protein
MVGFLVQRICSSLENTRNSYLRVYNKAPSEPCAVCIAHVACVIYLLYCRTNSHGSL